jgi:PAS domain S-box-containing protein
MNAFSKQPLSIAGERSAVVTSRSLAVVDVSQYALAPIGEDGEFVVYRGSRVASTAWPASVLVIMPSAEHPRPECVQMLEHEHALGADLDGVSVVRPLALVQHQGRTCLVLEDPGGELLERTLHNQRLEFGRCLRLGKTLCAALGALHRRGIIHKDLTPAHVMIDETTGQIWLTGFRIASRLRRERQTDESPKMIAGTLPYMAPEQTGWLNRSIDSRSDLYALGVMLYEMTTGTLPFSATDPLEWVHCHLARQPIPPAERVSGIPPVVSAIIMRLLAKSAEERYQTAAGIERDLQRCLAQWEAGRRIDDFTLGEHDISDRLLIPERLYGRAREIETLLAAFDRIAATGTPELMMVSGCAGGGKSSLVNALRELLVPLRGVFASGKFDQYKRGIPYATLVQALQSLVRRLLVRNDAELADWRATLDAALGPHGQLIVDLVPELKLIVGEQQPVPDLPPQEAQRRFQLVFQRFIQVFARPGHPLALFIDDLQWLDVATLDLLEHLLAQPDLRHVLVIGAYRDTEVDAAHPLASKLQAIRRGGAAVRDLALAPLTEADLTQLVGDTLHSTQERIATLARVIYDKTAGNPLFATQFLTALGDEGLLTFDQAQARWFWDIDAIHARSYTENVADLMAHSLARLPAETQRALQRFACIGNSAAVTTLALVFGTSPEGVDAALSPAVGLQLVEPLTGSYRFLHDRVQEAAYALVPESQRAGEHLRVGRVLVAHTPPDSRDEAIFEIVNQFNRGATLVVDPAERAQLSELNLIAGTRARASAAFHDALRYFTSGADALPNDAWESRAALTFALEFGRGECEFLVGDLAPAEERLARVAAHAANLVDEASVTCVRLALYTVLRRRDRAIDIGLSYLAKVGTSWAPHPTDEEVIEEHERLWRLLGGRPIESVFDLPLLSDPEISATLDVLTELQGPAYWTDQNLEHLLRLRTVNLSIQHGNTDTSAIAYAYLTAVLGPRFGEYAAGYRFARVGLALAEKKSLDRGRTRMYRNVGTWVVPWVRHLREARPLLCRALEGGATWRPLDYYLLWLYCTLVTHDLASGEPLLEVQREAEEGRRRLTQPTPAGMLLDVMTGQLGLIRTLRGVTPVFGSFDDEEIDDHQLAEHLQQNPELARPACWYWIRKLQAYVYAADHDRAATMAARAQPLLWTAGAEFLEADYHFYAALARAAVAEATSQEERHTLLAQVAGHHQRLLQWADSCPDNFESRAVLVGAEIARLDGRDLDAQRLYEQAIKSAGANGFINIEALANELAGRFYGARGFERIAVAYLKEARAGYRSWGAEGKVRQLDRVYPHLAREDGMPRTRQSISEHVEDLELATVLKALQAVSGEIVLEQLIDTLLRLAIEHAGAERGVLMISEAAGLVMRAEATVSGGTVTVRLRDDLVGAEDLAESVVHYVARAQQRVLLDDAVTSDTFCSDPYIRRTHARSILCIPLEKQGRLIAVLYLENHLASGVFTSARIAVLQVLAPQAALALQNSRLYRELEMREAKIRQLVDANIVGVAIARADGEVIEANDAALQIVGYTAEDVRSGRVRWRDLTPPEWQDVSTRAFAQLQATGRFDVFEKEYFRSDGSRVPVLLAGAAVDDARQEMVVFVIDITERKRAELERQKLLQLQADSAHVNRISLMGELAATLTHELKQPSMAAILDASTCLRLLSGDTPDVERARQAATRLVKGATLAAELIDRLRSFYKKEAPSVREIVNVNEVAHEMLDLLRSQAAQCSVSLLADLTAEPASVTADLVQLRQVLMNLILNGIEAMQESGGELTVTSRVATDGELTISVTDMGSGLPAEHIDQIFETFFSTKPQGSGMGLSISRSIVESHGGRLWATANAGRGATFHFTVPGAAANTSQIATPRAP